MTYYWDYTFSGAVPDYNNLCASEAGKDWFGRVSTLFVVNYPCGGRELFRAETAT
jgi:hypothetical protein